MNDSKGVSVLVVTDREELKEQVNTALRDSGHAAHCRRCDTVAELEAALPETTPELVLVFGAPSDAALGQAARLCTGSGAQVPVLLVTRDVDETAVADAMQHGARDAVSLGNIARFQSVAGREIRSCRLERTLERVMNSANQFKSELHSLKQVSVEAIADIHEGIIVNVNPAWLELFGYPDEAELIGQPVMDVCSPDDQAALKGGIVACQRGKWQDEQLEVSGLRPDGESFRVAFCLENVEHDGDPAVRMLVRPETIETRAPVDVVDQVVQRDPVTGFYNRQHFLDSASARLGEPPSGGVRALAYIRVDRFAHVAEDVGLLGTEDVLAQFAGLLREFTQPADIYGRFGGTMFVVLLERGNMGDAEAWAGRFVKTIADGVFEFEQRSTMLTCSVGLCELEPDGELPAQLAAAERACRSAREQGGNRLQFSETSGAAREVRQDDSIWIPRIRGALMENRLRLEHQPVAGLNDEIGEAYDILVRMLDEEGNSILPSEFMPAAVRTGMTKNIDRWVVGATLSFCRTNDAELLFVRLSRDSLLDDSLPAWLETQLQRTRVAPGRICFEVHEDDVVHHLVQAGQLAERLQAMGFRFAVEHLGRCPEAPQVLGHLRMDFAKIDGSLMQGLHKNAESQDRVKELVRLARDRDIATVAERVQDANTMAVLWQLGVSFIQGNYVQRREIVIEDTSQSTVTTRALQMKVQP